LASSRITRSDSARGVSGRTSDGGRGWSTAIAFRTAITESPANGWQPVTIT
jgi:hypothetical protein